MNLLLYLVILAYFIIGGIITLYVNERHTIENKKKNWLKYCTFFVIVNLLFASVMINTIYFHYLSILIILISFFEIVRLTYNTGKLKIGLLSLSFFTLFSLAFLEFSLLDKQLLIIVLFTVSIFDAFSQLTGQIMGKTIIFPRISPKKSLEGLFGGYLFSIVSSVIIFKMLNKEIMQSIYFGFGISTFAFLGDLSASYIKRKFEVKDYSSLLPGHGGFLDRFDSLIFSGSCIYVIKIYIDL